jgi:hypothetical protein
VALSREKLIGNLIVAQECEPKDFVIVVADVWPRKEDSEARAQIAGDDVRLVVLLVVDGKPHERRGDDRRAQEILDNVALTSLPLRRSPKAALRFSSWRMPFPKRAVLAMFGASNGVRVLDDASSAVCSDVDKRSRACPGSRTFLQADTGYGLRVESALLTGGRARLPVRPPHPDQLLTRRHGGVHHVLRSRVIC